jgi:hypothetical protein
MEQDSTKIESILGDAFSTLELLEDDPNENSQVLSLSVKFTLNNLVLEKISKKVTIDEILEGNNKNYLELFNQKVNHALSISKDEITIKEIQKSYSEILYKIIKKLESTFGFNYSEMI